MPLVMKENVTLDPIGRKLVPFECCNASSGGLRAPDRAVWACAAFYHQIRVYSADPRMNTCSASFSLAGYNKSVEGLHMRVLSCHNALQVKDSRKLQPPPLLKSRAVTWFKG